LPVQSNGLLRQEIVD